MARRRRYKWPVEEDINGQVSTSKNAKMEFLFNCSFILSAQPYNEKVSL